MSKPIKPMCAKCPVVACYASIGTDETPPIDTAPNYCPMKTMPETIKKATSKYSKSDIKEFARLASLQEFEGYENTPNGRVAKNPRIMELIQFARKCGYKKLGLAFCTGLASEAKKLTEILEDQGFEVVSVRCKVGAIPKEEIGIKPEEKIRGPGSWESMCNPITQAEVMNEEKVDLAVLLGLCIGHDTLFIKHCDVPITVIATKDRVTGHNPLAALYLTDHYYSWLKKKGNK